MENHYWKEISMSDPIVPAESAIARLNALVATVDRFLRGGATLNDLTEAVAAAELVTV